MKQLLSFSLFILSGFLHAGDVPASGDDIQPLKKGAKAPNPKLSTVEGTATDLTTLRNGTPTVLIFYRGGWCPYCQRHLMGLMDIEKTLTDNGWQLYALSPDQPSVLKEGLKDPNFSYTLVSDQDMNAAKDFGLAFKLNQTTLAKYKEYGIDLAQASGRNHQMLPVPAVILIDAEGVIQYIHTNPDYRKRLSNEKLLQAAGIK